MNKHDHESEGQNNSPGGASMFRDIDQSGAFCLPYYQATEFEASLKSLESWFSTPRLRRYASATRPDLLYIWNNRLSKAFLENVCHVEVLLRNFIHERLSRDCGQDDWYHAANHYHLNPSLPGVSHEG